MRRLCRIFFSRGALTVVCLAVQLAALWAAARFYGGAWLNAVMTAGAFALAIGIAAGRNEPGYKTAWCLLVLAVPVLGIVCYVLLGRSRADRSLRAMHSAAQNYLGSVLPKNDAVFERLAMEAPEAAAQSEALRRLCGASVWFGGQTHWFGSGEACFQAMLADLRGAKKSIWLEYFIIRPGVMWDAILTVLRQKAAEGLDVRVIYDDFGCIPGLSGNYPKRLREMRIACRVCNPFTPVLSAHLGSRDHRKLMLVDGAICYTGGINLSDEYIGLRSRFGTWKDGAIRLEGAAVYGCSALFGAMWTALGGEAPELSVPERNFARYCYVEPFWDSPVFPESVGRSAVTAMVSRAQERVWLMTPYLVPDEALTATLCLAAASGVDVRLITPGVGDKWYAQSLSRAHYPRLTEAGVKIYEYSPGFLHTKACCADGCVAVIGTVNLDYRSFYLQFENGVWLYGKETVAALEADFEETFPQCRRITPEDCAAVPWYTRILRAFIRLFAPLI